MMCWNVRLLAVCARFDGSKSRWWLILEREMVQSGQLNAIVEELRAEAG